MTARSARGTRVIAEGAFIEVLFPTTEKPRQPGLPHICYCLAVRPPECLAQHVLFLAG
jgi:hypothetical protein